MATLWLTISLLTHAATFSHSTIPTAFVSPSFRRSSCNAAINDKVAVGKITLLTKLKVSKHGRTNPSQMPLPQLLELLHKSNIRYPPNATREQLEDLLQRGRTVGVDTIRDNTKHQVVDVEVLPDQPQREFRGSNSRYKRVRRRNVSKSNNRQRRQRNNLRTNTDIIDVEFDLPPTPNDDGNYDNGLQIFVMGFVEAGKTAAELALDAATGTIRAPFVESNNNGWNNDEYNGRDDGDDYDRSREYKRERRRRRLTTRSIRPDYERATHLEQNEDSHYRSTDLACTDGTEQLLARPSAKINSTQTKPIHRSRNRSHDSDKPIYGLGYVQNESGTPSQHQHKRQWKDRLRNKFDAALGLDATAASTENVSYYDSWKRNIKAMGDSHKDRLRRNMQDDEKVSRASVPVNSTRVPQNRRSRMRAAKSGTKNESTSPPVQLPSNAPRIQKYKSNLRREEKPFWKERGSISSLLFDNNPSSFRKNMQKKSRKSLEQLLLSPSGRERTVTSLLIYIARSSLSIFGNLCRWAGVRGAIPQPIVVVTVCAVILSSYRQQKLFMLGLTLLAIRMLGEFIHGSVHGNEFWDDEYDARMHEWVAEDGGDA